MSNQRPDAKSSITVGDLAADNRDPLLLALRRNFLKPRYDIAEVSMSKMCTCCSGLERYPLHDGYYACRKCEKEKLSHFRADVMERYQ